MSNFFISTGESLSDIFEPLSTYQEVDASTNYIDNNGNDLKLLYASIASGGVSLDFSTNYIVKNYNGISGNNLDLSSIFSGKITFPFTVNSGSYSYTVDATNNYTVLFTTAGQIKFNVNVQGLQVIIIGGGGGGAYNTSSISGGGAGGGQAVIPFTTQDFTNKSFSIIEIGRGGPGATGNNNSGQSGGSTSFTDPSSNPFTYTVTFGNAGQKDSSSAAQQGTYTGPTTTSYGEAVTLYGGGGNGGIGSVSGGPTYGGNSYFRTSGYFLNATYGLGGGGGGCGNTGGEGGTRNGNGVGGYTSNSLNLDSQDAGGYGAGGGAYAGPTNYNPKRGGNGSQGACFFYFTYP
jgi:hypothetical protein